VVEEIDDLLDERGEPGPALRELLGETARLVGRQRLAAWVFRLRFEGAGWPGSLVVKRLTPSAARRNELAARQWLPALGLAQAGPPLLGAAGERAGGHVWHVYEDLGEAALSEGAPDPSRVAAVVGLIAQLHARSAEQPLLAECRLHGADFGASFYQMSVRDAIRSLEALGAPDAEPSPGREAVRDRLLGRLYRLADEAPERAAALQELGGPEALLHGDLWPKNALVVPGGAGLQVRLIDWDRSGVGPVSYDLSTFLGRLPTGARPWLLDLYRRALGRHGWRLPPAASLNRLFDTAERARLANCVIWRARAVREGHADWAFQELAWIEQWLGELQPILPMDSDGTA
jgi:Phosphotransferase enzyme family